MRASCARSVMDVQWKISGELNSVVLPAPAPGRRDGLWRTTCLEVFFAVGEGEGYEEFNLSPTDGWASYIFDGYRRGMGHSHAPLWVRREIDPHIWVASAQLDLGLAHGDDLRPKAVRLGFAAVIEDRDGQLSYWALTHRSDRPDFHDQDTFTLALPTPEPS